jgi:hypothetical protein
MQEITSAREGPSIVLEALLGEGTFGKVYSGAQVQDGIYSTNLVRKNPARLCLAAGRWGRVHGGLQLER